MANILDDICVDGAVLSSKLERQISNLSRDIERQSGGLLDQRDAAVDLRDRLQRQLEAREVARHKKPACANTTGRDDGEQVA